MTAKGCFNRSRNSDIMCPIELMLFFLNKVNTADFSPNCCSIGLNMDRCQRMNRFSFFFDMSFHRTQSKRSNEGQKQNDGSRFFVLL